MPTIYSSRLTIKDLFLEPASDRLIEDLTRLQGEYSQKGDIITAMGYCHLVKLVRRQVEKNHKEMDKIREKHPNRC